MVLSTFYIIPIFYTASTGFQCSIFKNNIHALKAILYFMVFMPALAATVKSLVTHAHRVVALVVSWIYRMVEGIQITLQFNILYLFCAW